MFAAETDGLVDSLIDAEYESAVAAWGAEYKNGLEATMVLSEEIDEVVAEIKKLTALPEDADRTLAAARAAIMELAQVCAVCVKIKNGYESND